MIPPAATAATTAAEVQLAGVPFPITLAGCEVSTARAAAGTDAVPAGVPGSGETPGRVAVGEGGAVVGDAVDGDTGDAAGEVPAPAVPEVSATVFIGDVTWPLAGWPPPPSQPVAVSRTASAVKAMAWALQQPCDTRTTVATGSPPVATPRERAAAGTRPEQPGHAPEGGPPVG